jgi:predicted 3-demethylubiquinone-9 3-methyltransferase (glyoxalase superfamily)
MTSRITTFLWFNGQAEEAMTFWWIDSPPSHPSGGASRRNARAAASRSKACFA